MQNLKLGHDDCKKTNQKKRVTKVNMVSSDKHLGNQRRILNYISDLLQSFKIILTTSVHFMPF